jgi:hypothetical protein
MAGAVKDQQRSLGGNDVQRTRVDSTLLEDGGRGYDGGVRVHDLVDRFGMRCRSELDRHKPQRTVYSGYQRFPCVKRE